MKDDTSTPITDGSSPNDFERDKPGTSARTDAEGAIEELRQRGGVFVNAVRATRMPMALTDPNLPGNPIVFANEAFLKLSGYSMDEVLGQQPHFMNGPATDPRDARRFEEALRSDQDDIIETVQYGKNGRRFVATVLISAYKDERGHTLNHFMSWLDVTRRVEAEDEVADLKKAQSALRESEAALRESEDRHAFLLKLSDALRPLSAPAEIQSTTARLVGEHLGVDRAMYGEVDGRPGSETGIIRGQYVRPAHDGEAAASPFPERFTFKPFGEHVMARRYRGEPIIVEDVETAEGFDEAERAAWREAGVRAAIVAPLAKGGRLVAEFGVHSAKARAWFESEVELVQDAAERTWDAAERARAEGARAASEEQYRTLFETMGQGFCELELVRDGSGRAVDQIYLQFNPAFERLFGIAIADARGRKASDLFPDLDPVWTETLARVAETGQPERIEHAFGADRWFEVFAYPAKGDRLNALYEEVSERKRAELALRDSEQKYAGLFAASPAPFLILRPDAPRFTIADVNDAYLAATMRTREDLIGRAMFDAFPDNPDDPAADGVSNLRASLERALVSRRLELMDVQKYDIVRPDGTFEERWWKPANSPVVDVNGNVMAIIHHVADVTAEHLGVQALQKSEGHAQILLAELQHRVRNTLAVVRSIALRTADNSSTAQDMLAHFQGRLDAFSRVQAAVTRSTAGKVDLTSLIEDELLAHAAHKGNQVRLTGPQVSLEPRIAERLSLAIHELTTNAVKHGALINGDAKLDISWEIMTPGPGARLALQWRESGVEIKKGIEREGFGMELLRRTLPYDLDAETKFDLRPDGLRFELDLPLGGDAAHA